MILKWPKQGWPLQDPKVQVTDIAFSAVKIVTILGSTCIWR